MSAPTAVPEIITVSADDHWIHQYADIASLRAHDNVDRLGDPRGAVEFFDSDGRRLIPVLSPRWGLKDLRPEGGRQPDRIRNRLTAVVEQAAKDPTLTPAQVREVRRLLELPPSTLRDVLLGPAAHTTEGPLPKNTRGLLHMILCHGFG